MQNRPEPFKRTPHTVPNYIPFCQHHSMRPQFHPSLFQQNIYMFPPPPIPNQPLPRPSSVPYQVQHSHINYNELCQHRNNLLSKIKDQLFFSGNDISCPIAQYMDDSKHGSTNRSRRKAGTRINVGIFAFTHYGEWNRWGRGFKIILKKNF